MKKASTIKRTPSKPVVRRSAFVNVYADYDSGGRIISVSDWDSYDEALLHRERSDHTYIETVEIRHFA